MNGLSEILGKAITCKDADGLSFDNMDPSSKKEVDEYLATLSPEHRRLVHDMYMDEINSQLVQIQMMLYSVHTIRKK